MYEIFESQVDNIEISREYNYLRNYKIEEIITSRNQLR